VNHNKKTLSFLVSRETGKTATDCQAVLEALLDILTDSLVKGNPIELRDYFAMRKVWRGVRPGMNMRTMEHLVTPAHFVVKTKFTPSLKNSMPGMIEG